jgi:hypothetical protein
MPNQKGKKTISMLVPDAYEFKGGEVKRELDAFFQWLWDNGGKDIIKQYPRFDKIKEMLTKW